MLKSLEMRRSAARSARHERSHHPCARHPAHCLAGQRQSAGITRNFGEEPGKLVPARQFLTNHIAAFRVLRPDAIVTGRG